MRSRSLAHGRRRGLHPGWRQAIGVGRHRRSSHAGHRRRKTVRSSRTTGPSGPSRHAVKVPVLGWTRTHPRRPVLLNTQRISDRALHDEYREPRASPLTGGGWVLLGPAARGAPWVLVCPPADVGTGASPSSAMRDRYSLSIRALS